MVLRLVLADVADPDVLVLRREAGDGTVERLVVSIPAEGLVELPWDLVVDARLVVGDLPLAHLIEVSLRNLVELERREAALRRREDRLERIFGSVPPEEE